MTIETLLTPAQALLPGVFANRMLVCFNFILRLKIVPSPLTFVSSICHSIMGYIAICFLAQKAAQSIGKKLRVCLEVAIAHLESVEVPGGGEEEDEETADDAEE